MKDLVEAIPSPLSNATSLSTLAGAWLASFASDNTRQAYRRDLSDFLGFCFEHEVPFTSVGRPGIDAYARSVEAAGKSPATVARRLSALASFYGYLVEEQVLATSPLERVRRPRVASDLSLIHI